MKTSLPSILRTALIAGFAQFIPIITIATASLVAISAQAQADLVETPVTGAGVSTEITNQSQSIALWTATAADTITMNFSTGHFLSTTTLTDVQRNQGIVANINVVNWTLNNGHTGSVYAFHGKISGTGNIDRTTSSIADTYKFTGDLSDYTGDFKARGGLTLSFSGDAISSLRADIDFSGSSKVRFSGTGLTGAVAVNTGTTMKTGHLYIEDSISITFNNTANINENGSLLHIAAGSTATFTQADLSIGGTLAGAGTLNVNNIRVRRASSSEMQINASGNVILKGANTFASINASNLTEATSLTLTGANTTSRITGNATTGDLTLSNGSALNVTGILTTTSITVNGSTGASITTPLISAGSIAAESLIISLTESALASMDFGDDGKFTLINLGTEFAGDIIFSVEGYKEATLANGGKDLIIWGGYTQYIITSDTSTTSGQQIFIQEGAKIPEPSTASLSLLALAGLLARRRRKQA